MDSCEKKERQERLLGVIQIIIGIHDKFETQHIGAGAAIL